MSRPLQLGHQQLDILDTLRRGPAPCGRLAEDTGQPAFRVRRAVATLQRRGLVWRWDADLWSLSPLGAKALLRAARAGRAPGVPNAAPRSYARLHLKWSTAGGYGAEARRSLSGSGEVERG